MPKKRPPEYYRRRWAERKVKRAQDPRLQRHAYLRRTFGIGIEDYEQMIADQDGRCLVCRRRPGNRWPDMLCVDHDHETGEIRGLLCRRCNVVLGFVRDDPRLLRRLAAYLTRTNK